MTRLVAVLVEPKTPGNIGAIARCLANFDGSELVLVNPRCSLTSRSYSRARSGDHFLDDVRVVDDLAALSSFDALLATTGILGGPGNLRRSPVHVDDVTTVIPEGDSTVGLVFGREDHGLDNDEIERCDHVVHIPACEEYPVLNLSHAACIVLYETYLATRSVSTDDRHPSREEKAVFVDTFSDIVSTTNDGTVTNEDEIVLAMQRLLLRGDVSKKELGALFKFLRRVQASL